VAADIAKLTVYHLARLVMIDPALDGARLERRPDADVIESTDPSQVAQALARLEQAGGTPADVVPDVRWGLVFSGASGERVRSAYVDANGAYGEIDGERVEFASDDLVQWLRETYGEDFVLS